MKKAIIVFIIALLVPFSYLCAQESTSVTDAPASDLTRLKCHPVRDEILETLRSEVESWSGQKVVFIVQSLKAKGSWAYAHVLPRSKDGKNKFEDVSALLNYEKGAWKIRETRPCCGECADDPDCADDRRYYAKLRSRFPSASQEIFPNIE